MHNILLTVQHEPGVEDVLKKKKKEKKRRCFEESVC